MTTVHFGLYGLGTMGSALALNIADKGFHLHVASLHAEDTAKFLGKSGGLSDAFTPHRSLAGMTKTMPGPRVIILLVPAGSAVEDSIAEARPHMRPGDVIIDAGNANFHDTRRHAQALEGMGLAYLGMGVSGGEEGARTGPAMMVGGTQSVWDGVRPLVEAIAAKFEGVACVDRVGPDGAGHLVKTVHNGIEYADMQLIAETYGVMRDGLGMAPAAIGDVFDAWNKGPLQSYLVEITSAVLNTDDATTGKPLVEMILDRAGQKGTGRWAAIEALQLGVSVSTIEAAVSARVWSAAKPVRQTGEKILSPLREDVKLEADQLEQALLAARIISHSQGFDLLVAASRTYDWSLDLARCAEIWRAGCIIRSALLNDIAAAFRAGPPDDVLCFAPNMVTRLQEALPALRAVVGAATSAGHPVPALSAALSWFDGMTQGRGTADLIQGQRDYFGRHGFERLDGGAGHHGPWAD